MNTHRGLFSVSSPRFTTTSTPEAATFFLILNLFLPQHTKASVATVEDSVLRTEMENLESQEEDAPRRALYFKMRPGLLFSRKPFSPPPREPRPRSLRKCRSRLVVARSFRLIHWGTTSSLVPPNRVPRRLTTGRLIKLLTSFAQPTK